MTVKLLPRKAIVILRRPRLLAQIAIGIISRGILLELEPWLLTDEIDESDSKIT